MNKFKRITVIVMDSLGIGDAPDADVFNDEGSDTFGHIAENVKNLNIPTLRNLGISNLHPLLNVETVQNPIAYYTRMAEASMGKDTLTGHWEMMGLRIDEPFVSFDGIGFPQDLVDALEKETGYGILGNKSASGTEIIEEYGEEHIQTKKMILYTSADSVLQIAAHEEVFGLEELYRCCEIARKLTLKNEWKVGRVIARPFVGMKKGEFVRTANRHDYALDPIGKTVLNVLNENNFDVISVGKINDIFNGSGITNSYRTTSNYHGMEETIRLTKEEWKGLLFVNLVDFDAKYGHRRNPQGYAKAIEEFDQQLGELLKLVEYEDLLVLTADHGNDPTYRGTDHTRERVPLLMYSPGLKGSGRISDRSTFSDLGATILENFELPPLHNGMSFLNDLE